MTDMGNPADDGLVTLDDTRKIRVASVVEQIEAANGLCHPADLVAHARNPQSIIHDCFDWDDKNCADQWRVYYARRLINTIKIEMIDSSRAPAPQFVHMTHQLDDGTRVNGYMSTNRALANPETRQRVLADALAALEGWRSRYDGLAELGDVFAAIDAVNARHGRQTPKKHRRRRTPAAA